MLFAVGRQTRRRNLWPGKVAAWWMLLLLLLPGCAPPTSHDAQPGPQSAVAIERLLDVMRQRLLVMHDVARWKWNAERPIIDPEREQAFLAAMQTKARTYQLEPGLTRSFFSAQMEAAKLLQQDDFRRWRDEKRGPFADAPDLATQLRPKIDALSGELLAALAAVQRQLSNPGVPELISRKASEVLTGEGISSEIRATALQPLLQDQP